jgi:hypothetical protein
MTYADYITDSLRLIGVLAHTESCDSDQGGLGLGVLNDMMARWEGDGIMVGYVQSGTTTDTLNLAPIAREAVKKNLAVLLCPYYERVPNPVVVQGAMAGYADLLLPAAIAAQVPSDLRDVPRGSGYGYGFDIMTGLFR